MSDSALRIGVLLYPAFDSLDVFGPYQIFTIMGTRERPVHRYLIGPSADDLGRIGLRPEPGESAYTTSFEGVRVIPDLTYRDYCERGPKLDVLFVPGALAPQNALRWGPAAENPFFQALDRAARDADWHTSVCTGALLLAAAGLLDGCRATTHWAYREILALYPRVTLAEGYPRYVRASATCPRRPDRDVQVVTGGGISSGLDEGLMIASLITGEANAKRVQLSMQYHPRPDFDCGDPQAAEENDPAVLEASREQMAAAGIVTKAKACFMEYSKLGDAPGT